MVEPTRTCYDDGSCYDVYTDAWHVWGRWVLLGALIAFLLLMIPFCGWLMSLRRVRLGMAPVPGCGWMFSNPYKNAKSMNSDEAQLTQRPQRYKPYDPYREHQRELMLQNEQMRLGQTRLGYVFTNYEGSRTGETDTSSSMEKPSMHKQLP